MYFAQTQKMIRSMINSAAEDKSVAQANYKNFVDEVTACRPILMDFIEKNEIGYYLSGGEGKYFDEQIVKEFNKVKINEILNLSYNCRNFDISVAFQLPILLNALNCFDFLLSNGYQCFLSLRTIEGTYVFYDAIVTYIRTNDSKIIDYMVDLMINNFNSKDTENIEIFDNLFLALIDNNFGTTPSETFKVTNSLSLIIYLASPECCIEDYSSKVPSRYAKKLIFDKLKNDPNRENKQKHFYELAKEINTFLDHCMKNFKRVKPLIINSGSSVKQFMYLKELLEKLLKPRKEIQLKAVQPRAIQQLIPPSTSARKFPIYEDDGFAAVLKAKEERIKNKEIENNEEIKKRKIKELESAIDSYEDTNEKEIVKEFLNNEITKFKSKYNKIKDSPEKNEILTIILLKTIRNLHRLRLKLKELECKAKEYILRTVLTTESYRHIEDYLAENDKNIENMTSNDLEEAIDYINNYGEEEEEQGKEKIKKIEFAI